MVIDKKQFTKIQRKVVKKYPKAKTMVGANGLFYVHDGEGNFLTKEYMIPNQPTVGEAWYWFADTMKINQNIERTNPNRMDLKSFEAKFARLSKRNRK
tara:strand:+ start:417 stop:710 length:294 start_codon:yes stop_codon:yes gene_type:complete